MPKHSTDYTGQRFGRLVVMHEEERAGRVRRFLCHCDCGNDCVVSINNLRTGSTVSCGCYRSERLKSLLTKHKEDHDSLD